MFVWCFSQRPLIDVSLIVTPLECVLFERTITSIMPLIHQRLVRPVPRGGNESLYDIEGGEASQEREDTLWGVLDGWQWKKTLGDEREKWWRREIWGHVTLYSVFFPDLSLRCSVPGEKEGAWAVGTDEEKERKMQDLKREKGIDRERVGHCEVRPGGSGSRGTSLWAFRDKH